MLTTNRTRETLAAGGTVHGLICSIPSPTLVEMIGCAGYDFVVIDTEHTGVDPQQLENIIRAAEAVGVTPFVRVGSVGRAVDTAAILRALDAGALGSTPSTRSSPCRGSTSSSRAPPTCRRPTA